MAYYYLRNSKEKIRVSDKEFASGGEGSLHKILTSSHKNYVAKLYHPAKCTPVREKKIQHLIKHPPSDGNNSLVWISDALYNAKKEFVGFIMPFVQGKKLEILCLGKLPRKLNNKWNRFDFKNNHSLEHRLRVCFNLAAAIYQIHSSNNYVLVDMKPDNIIIQANGILAIVDMDSVEVLDDTGQVLYPAPVATPEYTPVEFYTQKDKHSVTESWDRFGLAVIFYKLLFGIHPFATTAHEPYEKLVSLHQKIEMGLFAHHPDAKNLLRIIPPPHQNFTQINQELQSLFVQCFVDGHENPEFRPTANEWCLALLSAIGSKDLKQRFAPLLGLDTFFNQKFKLPSSLIREYNNLFYPQKWAEKKLNSLTKIPFLPLGIQSRLIQEDKAPSPKEKKTIYLWTAAFSFFTVLYLLLFTSFRTWINSTLWTYSTLSINIIFILWIVFTLYVLPFIINRIRKNSFLTLKKNYPLLKNNALVLKEQLKTHLSEIKNTPQRELIISIKNTLKEEDKKVKALLTEKKEKLRAIQQKYFNISQQDDLLQKISGNSLERMLKNIPADKKRLLSLLTKEESIKFKKSAAYQSLIIAQRKEQKKLTALEEEKIRAYKKQVAAIDDIQVFVRAYAKSNSFLVRLFRKNGIFDLKNLKEVTIYPQNITLHFIHGQPFKIPTNIHSDIKTLGKHLKDLLFIAKFLRNKNYKNHPVQQYMTPKKKALKKKYKKLAAAKIDRIVKNKKIPIEKKLAEAQLKLEKLITQQNKEKETLVNRYKKPYDKIFAEAKAKIKTPIQILKKEHQDYKIQIESILQTPHINQQNKRLQKQIKIVSKKIKIFQK